MAKLTHGDIRVIDQETARALNRARQEAGLSYPKLGELVDMSEPRVGLKMRGDQPLYVHDVAAIAAACGTSLDEIMRQACEAVRASGRHPLSLAHEETRSQREE